MVHQLIHVLKTYLTRKLLWLLAAVYALTIWCEANVPIRQTPLLWNEIQTQWLPRKEFDGLTAFLDWQANDDDLRELRGLTLKGQFVEGMDHIGPEGKPAPTLKLDHKVLPEHLSKLAKCVRLTELHWFTVELSPEVGQTLANLPQLRQLELTLMGAPFPSLEHLPTMPELEIFQIPGIPPAELGSLAKHPRLRTIVLQDSIPYGPLAGTIDTSRYEIWRQPSTLRRAAQIEQVIIKPASEYEMAVREGVPHYRIAPDAVYKGVPISESLRSELAKLPNLKAVEVRDPWGGWPARVIDDPGLRQSLAGHPNVAFNPMAFKSESLLSPFAGFSSVVLLVILGLQMFSHFATSASHTMPNFAKPHLIIAAIVLIVHVALVAGITVVRRDVAGLPAIVLTLALPVIGILIASLLSLRPATFPLLFPLTFAGIMTMFTVGPVLVNLLGANEFFHGNQPVRALVILACEIAVVFWAIRSLVRLPRSFSEAGIPVGLGFSQTLQQLQMRKLNQSGAALRSGRLNTKFFERRLEAFLAAEERKSSGVANAVQQWRAGEPANQLSILLMCLLGPWLLVGLFSLVFGLMSGQWVSGKLFVFYCVVFGTFSFTVATLVRCMGTYSRRPVLAQELLRPMRRSEMIQHLRSSMWSDLRPAFIVTLGYLLTLLLIHSWGPRSWSSQTLAEVSFSHAMLVLALPVPIWGGTVFLLSVRKEFWLGTVIAIAYFALFVVTQIYTMARLIDVTQIPEATAIATAASYWIAGTCVVIGITLAWWGDRRLPQVEWGATG